MTPRNEYLLMAFVWTSAIMTVALIIAYFPFIHKFITGDVSIWDIVP